MRGRGSFDAVQRIKRAEQGQSEQKAERAEDEAGGEARLARGADRERGDRRRGGEHAREQLPAGAAQRFEPAAEQRRRRDDARAAERDQSEHQGDQQAVGGAGEQGQRIEREPRRDRQRGARESVHHQRHQSADREPDQDRGQGDEADLEQIGNEDRAAGRAEQFQRRDDVALGVEPGGDAVADADPGDDQSGEADQGEELAEPLDEAARARRAVAAVVNVEATVGEGGLDPLGDRLGRGGGGKADAIGGRIEAARLDEAGRVEPRAVDQSGRAEHEALAGAVGLLGDQPDDAQICRADPKIVTDPQPKPLGKVGGDRDLRARRARRERAGPKPERPVERVGGIDPLQFDQHAFGAVEPRRHRAHPADVRDAAFGRERGEFGGRRGALAHLDLDVAAEDRLALLGEAGHDRARQRADSRQRGDAEEQADGEQPQPGQAAAQIAQGEAEREIHAHPSPSGEGKGWGRYAWRAP